MPRPFNFELARAGAEIQTNSGEPARIVCDDYRGPNKDYNLLVLIDSNGVETPLEFRDDGTRENATVYLEMVSVTYHRYSIIGQGDSGLFTQRTELYYTREQAERALDTFEPKRIIEQKLAIAETTWEV